MISSAPGAETPRYASAENTVNSLLLTLIITIKIFSTELN